MPRGRQFTNQERAMGMRKLLKNPKVNLGMKGGIMRWLDANGFKYEKPEPAKSGKAARNFLSGLFRKGAA